MGNIRICDMADNQKPYEKAISNGISSLSDAELLTMILRCGTKDESSLILSERVLNAHPVYKGLIGLNYLSDRQLKSIKGIGKVKALQLTALAEISKRMSMERFKPKLEFSTPKSIADYFMESCRYLTTERVYALFLNGSNALIDKIILSEGTVNKSLMSPRELFIEALKYDAVSIILLHNHPSGSPEPSDADIITTKKITELGKLLGVRLLDHIILGDKCYVSLGERGLI